MQTLNFNENYNNKLNCHFFTTIRMEDKEKFFEGSKMQIKLNGKPIGFTRVVMIRKFFFYDMNEFMTTIDLGTNLEEGKKIIRTIYSHIDLSENFLLFILLESISINQFEI